MRTPAAAGGTAADLAQKLSRNACNDFGSVPVKDLSIVVTGYSDDLPRIAFIWPVEFIAIGRAFVWSINDITQMKKECGILPWVIHVEVGSHLLRYVFCTL